MWGSDILNLITRQSVTSQTDTCFLFILDVQGPCDVTAQPITEVPMLQVLRRMVTWSTPAPPQPIISQDGRRSRHTAAHSAISHSSVVVVRHKVKLFQFLLF